MITDEQYEKLAEAYLKKRLLGRKNNLLEALTKNLIVKYDPVNDCYTASCSLRVSESYARLELADFLDQQVLRQSLNK